MKYLSSFLLVIAFASNNFSQEKSTIYYDVKGQKCLLLTNAIKYSYEYFDSIKNHTYKEVHNLNTTQILFTGSYLNNTTRDGLFIDYYDNGNVLDSGYYYNGRINGVWHYFYKKGQLAYVVQYSDSIFKYIKCYDELGKAKDCLGKTDEIMPAYIGGINALMDFLKENISYPDAAKKNKSEGKVIVKFYIDFDGHVREPQVLKDNVGNGCADEALRVVSLMPNWIPGVQRNKMVKVYYTLPISFSMPSK